MPTVAVIDINKKAKGKIDLPDEFFGIKNRDALLHVSVVNFLANQRQGTHATKTKGKVRGGGRKPYRQKGSGRARAGSIRSPLWKGGGVTFGPNPRDYSYQMPRQAKKLALYAALSAKLADDEMVVVDSIALDEPKTKRMVEILDTLELSGGRLLIVVTAPDAALALSARNIPEVRLMSAKDLHAYDVLSSAKVLMTKAAVKELQEQAEK
jgi:large subunit ribosomal protein L4